MDSAVTAAATPRERHAGGSRDARTTATRQAIMSTAERLFAERGVYAVSNRQVGEAAGQANNTAVGYHFGSKTDLIREIIQKHSRHIDFRRAELLTQVRGSSALRDWVSCLVLPSTEHFATLGVPSWYARFNAQVMADPTLRAVIYEDALTSDALKDTLAGLRETAADLPADTRRTRADMARQLLVYMCAERERELALGHADDGTATPVGRWESLGVDLVDALTGLWTAPVTL